MFQIINSSPKPLAAQGMYLVALSVQFRCYLSSEKAFSRTNLNVSKMLHESSNGLFCCQVMSRHSWRDQASQPKIKYFMQAKARPPTFVAFVKGKNELPDSDIRFLIKSLKEDFDMGGIPIRILQKCISRKIEDNSKASNTSSRKKSHGKKVETVPSSKRTVNV